MGYSVEEYLNLMEAAGRTAGTIRKYRMIFESFARFQGVPVEELHDHLEPDSIAYTKRIDKVYMS